MDNQDSKILTELTELKEIFIKLQTTIKELPPIADKIEQLTSGINTYDFTNEEKQVVEELEPIVEDVYNVVEKFYY